LQSNIDRLYALYQAAYPDRPWIPQDIGSAGNVWLENGQTVSADTPLLPFRKASGGFWTTNDARDTRSFGYAYPETAQGANISELDIQTHVQEDITTMYGSSARRMLMNLNAQTAGPVANAFTDWSIAATAMVSALPPSFVVRFMLTGDFSSDEPVDVGSWVKLMPESHHNDVAEKRASTVDTMHSGTVSLTASLLDQVAAGRLSSLEASDVVPHLSEKLSWTVVSVSMFGRCDTDTVDSRATAKFSSAPISTPSGSRL
jgi:tyrosinase